MDQQIRKLRARMTLTTEALITEVPEPEKPAAPPMPEY